MILYCTTCNEICDNICDCKDKERIKELEKQLKEMEEQRDGWAKKAMGLEKQLNELPTQLKKFHPYQESIFPTTTEEAAKLLKLNGLTDNQLTSISGCIARIGYDACLFNLDEVLKDVGA